MTPITLTLIKLAFLAVLWLFVIAAVGVIRADLFGSKAAARAAARPRGGRAAASRPARAPRAPSVRGGGQDQPHRLVVTQGELAGTTFDLTPGVQITIGRANDSTLVVTDDYASSRHARIYAQNGRWIVEDLGSTNGTYLGRTKVAQPEPIPLNTPIRIGKTFLELRK